MCKLSLEKVRFLFECGFLSSVAFIHDLTVRTHTLMCACMYSVTVLAEVDFFFI